jgi:hypothetical protein
MLFSFLELEKSAWAQSNMAGSIVPSRLKLEQSASRACVLKTTKCPNFKTNGFFHQEFTLIPTSKKRDRVLIYPFKYAFLLTVLREEPCYGCVIIIDDRLPALSRILSLYSTEVEIVCRRAWIGFPNR